MEVGAGAVGLATAVGGVAAGGGVTDGGVAEPALDGEGWGVAAGETVVTGAPDPGGGIDPRAPVGRGPLNGFVLGR